jgi:hypothetical protein
VKVNAFRFFLAFKPQEIGVPDFFSLSGVAILIYGRLYERCTRMIRMSNAKHARGRPRGTGKDDTGYLEKVAELLVRQPSLKPTTAMKQVMAGRNRLETEATLLRRWQSKWQRDGSRFLMTARESAKPRRTLREQIAGIASGQITELERQLLCRLSEVAADSLRAMLLTPQMKDALKSWSEEMTRLHSVIKSQAEAFQNIGQLRIVFPQSSWR